MNLEYRFHGVFLGEVVIGGQQGKEILLGECFLDVVAHCIDGFTQVIGEVEQGIEGVDVIKVGLEVVLKKEI